MRSALPIIIVLFLLCEIYTFVAIKTVVRTRWLLWAYVAVSVIVIAYVVWSFFNHFDRSVGQTKHTLFTIGLVLLTIIPKLIIGSILLFEDVFRFFSGAVRAFTGDNSQSFFAERRKFVSQLALGIAAIPFLSLLYGMTKGKYNFKVRKEILYFPDLPENFDGFTITQISDVHSGSFDDKEEIEHAIDLINQQKSDIILFTGDIVNTHAEEMYKWIDTFKRIEMPPMGKFSVLGNHDYGEYIEWPSREMKDKNFADIKGLHDKIDFKLLLNENIRLKKGNQEISLVGVENWGVGFKQAGDLAKASQGVAKNDFKILMSHDPSHWEHEVKNHADNYHLTLSGHTHGMQFGIEIPGFFKWSPVQYRYEQWAGLYENLGRYIYVNRGFGFHAYPGRVGIWPEITVLELKKGEKVS